MDTYPPSRAGPPRAAGAGLCAIYFLQNASFLPTFLRRVPRGFFSTTSSLEESSLDDDEEDDAFAAVDAGAAASSVLAYLVARSSMSLVCLRDDTSTASMAPMAPARRRHSDAADANATMDRGREGGCSVGR